MTGYVNIYRTKSTSRVFVGSGKIYASLYDAVDDVARGSLISANYDFLGTSEVTTEEK